MLEQKCHVSNSKNKDLLYNCILDKPIHSIEQVVQMSGLRGLRQHKTQGPLRSNLEFVDLLDVLNFLDLPI